MIPTPRCRGHDREPSEVKVPLLYLQSKLSVLCSQGACSGRLLVAVALGLGLVALGVGCLSPVVCFLPDQFLFCGVQAWKGFGTGLR